MSGRVTFSQGSTLRYKEMMPNGIVPDICPISQGSTLRYKEMMPNGIVPDICPISQGFTLRYKEMMPNGIGLSPRVQRSRRR